MSAYSRFFGSSIIEIITSIFSNLVYAYSALEYRTEQLTNIYSHYKTKYADPVIRLIYDVKTLDNTQSIIYVKNNVEYVSDEACDNVFDFAFLIKEDKAFIDNKAENLTDRCTSESLPTVSFITFDVTFKDNENTTEDVSETFSLNLTKNANYVQVGNKIDKHVIWYLVKKQFGVCNFGKSYVLQVIDNNVNMFTLYPTDTITIMETGIKTD